MNNSSRTNGPVDIVGPGPEEKARLQSDRLTTLVRRLAEGPNEAWREKLADVDPETIVSIADIGCLPFTTKQDLRDTYPMGMVIVPIEEVVRLHASSGTSGKPTIVAYTRADLALWAECNARALALAGVKAGDILHNSYGYGLFTGGLGLHYGGERLGAAVVPVSGGNSSLQLQLLEDLGARAICATPSFSLLLAERAAEAGLLDRLNLEVGILGAEPWSEGMRTRIESAWGGGFRALDIYGLSEVIGPGVAMESPDDLGALQLFDDHFFAEIVDPETGDPLPDGHWGELVVTTLTKEAMPLLRYRTGDITRILEGPGTPGRNWIRIARITGRADDMLIIRGINVYPREVEAVLLEDPDLSGQYAIVVDRRTTMTELRVRAESDPGAADRTEEVASRLEAALLVRVRVRVRVEVVPPGSMARTEMGKVQRVFEQTDDRDPLG